MLERLTGLGIIWNHDVMLSMHKSVGVRFRSGIVVYYFQIRLYIYFKPCIWFVWLIHEHFLSSINVLRVTSKEGMARGVVDKLVCPTMGVNDNRLPIHEVSVSYIEKTENHPWRSLSRNSISLGRLAEHCVPSIELRLSGQEIRSAWIWGFSKEGEAELLVRKNSLAISILWNSYFLLCGRIL